MHRVVYEEIGREVGVTATRVRTRPRGEPRPSYAEGDGPHGLGFRADVREPAVVDVAP